MSFIVDKVADIGRLVMLWCCLLTHVAFILKRESTTLPPTMEMRSPLAEEGAVRGPAFLGGPESLEALLYNGRILAVIIGVHLHVRGGDVDLVAALLDAVIVRLFLVVRAIGIPIGAII